MEGLTHSINLTLNPPTSTNVDFFSIARQQGCEYKSVHGCGCWTIVPRQMGSYFEFKLNLASKQGINLIFRLCHGQNGNSTHCPIAMTVNGKKLVSGIEAPPKPSDFFTFICSVPADMLKQGSNVIILGIGGGKTECHICSATVDLYYPALLPKNWLAEIDDQRKICDINMPGTHDSAAIRKSYIESSPYACHSQSISEQLNGGIRILDVRLKVQYVNGQYKFITCHGDIGSGAGLNEYLTCPKIGLQKK